MILKGKLSVICTLALCRNAENQRSAFGKCTNLTFDCMGLQFTFAFMVEGNALLLII